MDLVRGRESATETILAVRSTEILKPKFQIPNKSKILNPKH